MAKTVTRCEGWRRTGIFQTGGGTGRWEQCTNDATVMMKSRADGGKATTLPACDTCVEEARTYKGIEVLSVLPIKAVKKKG